MHVRRIRAMLWAWTTGCLILSAATAVRALRAPDGASPAPTRPAEPDLVTMVGGNNVPDLSQLRAAAAIDLRRPLYDAPPPPPPAAPPRPPLTVKLAGTIIEDGYSRAILQTPEGKMEFRRVGERTGEAEVVSIEQGRVTLQYHGEPVILTIERAVAAGGGR